LCNSNVYRDRDPRNGLTLIICGTCGKFRFGLLGGEFLHGKALAVDDRLYKVSHYLRTISERGFGKQENSYFPIYSAADFEQVMDSPDPGVVDKLRMLLQYLGASSNYPGEVNEFDASCDYPIVCAKNYQEATFYLNSLIDQGLCVREAPFTGRAAPRYAVSAAGWKELDQITKSAVDSAEAFIAMWFDSSREPLDSAISRAVQKAGYTPIRIDRVEHVNRIDDEILARIRRAKFLIADFTGQRNGVYFEAGFMLGIGRPVIWICEKTELSAVHFDTRQYNTIDYVSPDDLQERLQFRIEALLGKGPTPSAEKQIKY